MAVVKKYFSSWMPRGVAMYLLRGDAADGALVHFDRGGDIAQDERAQMADAEAEEAVLLADDFGRHLQDGLRALLQRLDQPVGGLQLLGQEGAILAAHAGSAPGRKSRS